MHEVLRLEELNYGLWQDEPRNLGGLKEAQRRYSRELCDWVPDGVHSVLDVGCGTGGNSLRLKSMGFEVEGLSPDPYQQQVYEERTGLPFHLRRLQEFHPGRPYDLTLMSESAQYVWLESLFPLVRQVSPEGYLLVCDYFVRDGIEGPLAKSGHPLGEFMQQAKAHDFVLLRQEDITEQTLPTLDLASQWLERYIRPSMHIAEASIARRRPWLTPILRRVLRGPLTKFEEATKLLDRDRFQDAKVYLRLLFQHRPGQADASS